LNRIKRELVRGYDPVCIRDTFEFGDLSRDLIARLDSVQKKQNEQEALLRVMIAAIGHQLQPPPEPKKRIAGFHSGACIQRLTRTGM
jgi:hypothetical protein